MAEEDQLPQLLYRTSDGIIAKRYVDIIPRCFQVLDIASLTLRHAAGAVISNKKLVYFKKILYLCRGKW